MDKTPKHALLFLFLFAANLGSEVGNSVIGAEKVENLRFQFEVEVEELNKPLKELNQKYSKHLEIRKTAYQNSGKLKALLATEEELKNFKQSTEGELSSFPELKRLQKIYREQRVSLVTKSKSLRLQLIRGYRENAESLASEWTKSGRIEDAKAAMAEAERLAALEKNAAKFTPTISEPGKGSGSVSPGGVLSRSFPLRLPSLEDRPSGQIRVFGTFVDGKEKKILELGELSKHRDFVDLGISGSFPKNRMALRKKGGIEVNRGTTDFKNFSDDSRIGVMEIVSSANRSLLLLENGKVWGSRYEAPALTRGAARELTEAVQENVVSAAVTINRICLLKSDGSVFYPFEKEPKEVLPNPESRFIQISSTGIVYFGLKPDGKVETWGDPTNVMRLAESMKDHPRIVRLARGGSSNHMLGLTKEGKVIGWHHYPRNAPTFGVLDPPGDLDGQIIDLKVGRNVSAIKIKNRGWKAWGYDKWGVIDQINKLGPGVIDLEAQALDPDGNNFVVWIED